MIFRKTIVLAALIMATSCGATNEKYNESPTETSPADYVSTLVGSLSSFEISTGNTYPAIALPWGMNFWTPQTGKMGDGWTYRYDAHRIRGIKQTHQPSPWINDYGQFSIMPVRDVSKTDEEARASWFSHQSETAKPYYYSVYLADHDVKAEVAPSDRAAVLRFTFQQELRCNRRRLRQRLIHQGYPRGADHCRIYHTQQRRSSGEFPQLVRYEIRQAF